MENTVFRLPVHLAQRIMRTFPSPTNAQAVPPQRQPETTPPIPKKAA
ncbi:hypothetical protein [Kingella oralis]|nr:hypothetical protein [Kingella oralis]